MHCVMQKPLLGDLRLGNVAERADEADHIAVGSDNRPGLHAEPVMVGAGATQAEFLVDPAAPLLKNRVEAGAEAVPLARMHDV